MRVRNAMELHFDQEPEHLVLLQDAARLGIGMEELSRAFNSEVGAEISE